MNEIKHPDLEMVEKYLGVFIEHAKTSSPNSSVADNARNATLALITAVRQEPRPITEAMLRAYARVLAKAGHGSPPPEVARAALDAAEKVRR